MAENGNYYTEQPVDEQQGVASTWKGGSQLENARNGETWQEQIAREAQEGQHDFVDVRSINFRGGRNYAANAGNFFHGMAVKHPHNQELGSPDYYIAKGWTAENALAAQQTNLQRLGNGLLQCGTIAVGTFLGNTAGLVTGLINGVGSAIEGEGFTKGFVEQPVSKFSNKMRNWVQNATPIYHSNEYDNKTVLGRAFTNEFWADLMAQAGFTIGAAGSVAAYTALAAAAGIATGGVGAAGILSTGVISLFSSLGEATVEALTTKQENEQAMYAELTRQYNERMANASTAEEYSEVANWYAEQSQQVSEFLKQQENRQFGLNVAVLSVSNALMFGRMMSRGAKATASALAQRNAATALERQGTGDLMKLAARQAVGETVSEGERSAVLGTMKQASEAAAKARRLERTAQAINQGKKVKVATDATGMPISLSTNGKAIDYARAGLDIGKTALSEGGEEWSQFVLSNEWKRDPYLPDFYAATFNDDSIQKADSMMSAYFATIAAAMKDPQAWQEAFMGALTGILGVPGGGNMSFRNGKITGHPTWNGGVTEAYQTIREGADRRSTVESINEMLSKPNGSFRSQYEALVGSITDEGFALSAAQAGDKFDFENYRHRSLVRILVAADKLGITEQLYGPIADAMSRITEEEVENLRQQGIIQYDGTAEDYVNKTRKAGQELKEAINNILDIKTDTMARHGNVLSDEAMSNIIYGKMQVNNWENRRSRISEETNALLDRFDISEGGLLTFDGKAVKHNLGEDFDKMPIENKRRLLDNLRLSVNELVGTNEDIYSSKDENGNTVTINAKELRAALSSMIETVETSDNSKQSRKEAADAINDIDRLNDSIKEFNNKIAEYEASPQKANDDVNDTKAKAEEKKKKKESTKRIKSAKEALSGKNNASEVRKALQDLNSLDLSDEEKEAALTELSKERAIQAHLAIEKKRQELLDNTNDPLAAFAVNALANSSESEDALEQALKHADMKRSIVDDVLNSNVGTAILDELAKKDEKIKAILDEYNTLAQQADKVDEAEAKRQELIDKLLKHLDEEIANADAIAENERKLQEKLDKDLEGIAAEDEAAEEEAKKKGNVLTTGNDPTLDFEEKKEKKNDKDNNDGTEQSDNTDELSSDNGEDEIIQYNKLKGVRKPLAYFNWKDYNKNKHSTKTIRDNPKFAKVAAYYESKKIKETVDSGEVSIGDTLSIMVDTIAKDDLGNPIITYVKTYPDGSRKVVGIFQAIKGDETGKAIKDDILATYKREGTTSTEFFDTGYKCKVEDVTRGKLNYHNRGETKDLGETAGNLRVGQDFSIGFIGRENGINKIKYAYGSDFSSTENTLASGLQDQKYNGMPIAIIKVGKNRYKYAPIAVRTFSREWYNANKNTPIARKLDSAIDGYLNAKDDSWKHYADEIKNILYLGNNKIRFQFAKKDDKFYLYLQERNKNGDWKSDKSKPKEVLETERRYFKNADEFREQIFKLFKIGNTQGVQFNITANALNENVEDYLKSNVLFGELASLQNHYVEFGVSEFYKGEPQITEDISKEVEEFNKEIENESFDDEANEYDDDFAGMFMEYDESGERIDLEKEREVTSRMLGEIDIEYAERLQSMSGNEKSGIYSNGKILISRRGNRGVTYHEAFHYVFDKLLSDEEKEFLYKNSEGSFFHYDGSIIDISERKLIEENLAEEFRQYVLDRESFIGRVKSAIVGFFERLYNFLVGIDNVMKNNRTAIYRDIYNGRWKIETSGNTYNNSITEMEREVLHSNGISDNTIDLMSEEEKNVALDCAGF